MLLMHLDCGTNLEGRAGTPASEEGTCQRQWGVQKRHGPWPWDLPGPPIHPPGREMRIPLEKLVFLSQQLSVNRYQIGCQTISVTIKRFRCRSNPDVTTAKCTCTWKSLRLVGRAGCAAWTSRYASRTLAWEVGLWAEPGIYRLLCCGVPVTFRHIHELQVF